MDRQMDRGIHNAPIAFFKKAWGWLLRSQWYAIAKFQRSVLMLLIVWWTDGQKDNVALAHKYHVGRSGSKFGWILSSRLGGDSVMEGQTDSDLLTPPEGLCLCWGFTAQSTQQGHVERGQFT